MLHATILLFAQQGRPKGDEGVAAAVAIGSLCCYALIFVLIIAFLIYFLMTAYQALNAVSPRNRDMEPGMVFLHFIPFFGMVWDFFIVLRIASSLRKEFEDRDLPSDGGDYGQTLGLWALILSLVGCAPVNLILFVMWLMKIRAYTATLTGKGNARRSRDRDDVEADED